MTRKSRIPSLSRGLGHFEMEMTPMIDVTFLLLIFFMCTLKFKSLEGQLGAYLPKNEGVNSEPSEISDPLEVGILVRESGNKLAMDGSPWTPGQGGRWNFDQTRRVEYSLGPLRGLTLKELGAELDALDPQAYPQGVVLSAKDGTVQGEAVETLDVLLDAGFTSVRLRGAETD